MTIRYLFVVTALVAVILFWLGYFGLLSEQSMSLMLQSYDYGFRDATPLENVGLPKGYMPFVGFLGCMTGIFLTMFVAAIHWIGFWMLFDWSKKAKS